MRSDSHFPPLGSIIVYLMSRGSISKSVSSSMPAVPPHPLMGS